MCPRCAPADLEHLISGQDCRKGPRPASLPLDVEPSVPPEVPERVVHYGARDLADMTRPWWASSANAKCSAAIGCAASRVCGGLLTSSRMSAKPTSSSRAPSLSSHDRSTADSSDAVRLLQAPAQPKRGKMS